MTDALGFVGHTNGATMPGAEVSDSRAFCFQGNKLEPNSFEGIDPLICGAKALDTRLSNGLSAGEGVSAVVDDRQRGWFWLSNHIIDEHGPALGPFGIAAYVALVRHANADGKCFPSLATLASETGMGRTKLIEALAKIQSLGLMTITHRQEERRGQVANVYTLTAASPKEPATPVRHTDGGASATRTTPVRHTDTKEYPQEGLTTPPNGGGAVPPPAKPKTAKSRSKPDADPRTNEVVAAFEELMGYPMRPTWGREAKAAKVMLASGYDPEAIIGCAADMRDDPFWQEKSLHLDHVSAAIGKWRQRKRPTAERDARFWFRGPTGAWGLRHPSAVEYPPPYSPTDYATWPPEMQLAYRGSSYAAFAGGPA